MVSSRYHLVVEKKPMIHILAIAGFAVILILPINLGTVVFAPMRTRDRLMVFVSTPFSFIVAVILVAIGWGDWPDLPANVPDGLIFKSGFALGAVGLVLGIVAWFNFARLNRRLRLAIPNQQRDR